MKIIIGEQHPNNCKKSQTIKKKLMKITKTTTIKIKKNGN